MKYLLKNKDKVVLEFEITIIQKDFENTGKVIVSNIAKINIFDNKMLPIGIKTDNVEQNLKSWIYNRKAPENRAFVEKIVATYKQDNKSEEFMDYVRVSLALSLNDSYWIIPADSNYEWNKYNLYANKFDEALALVAFNGNSHKVSGITSSPEYTTEGNLKKCWHRENGQIYLYKGSNRHEINRGKEPYSEYYMAQVAKALGFEHTPYDLREFHRQVVSTCPLFTNENEGYLSISHFVDRDFNKQDRFEKIESITKTYNSDKMADLMLFDSLIGNSDRHLGNFGMIIDNNTNEILRPAPIFDNGFSMINYLQQKELGNIQEVLAHKKSYFGFSFNEQMQRFVRERHIPALEKLKSFEFTKHKEFNLPDMWLESIQKTIQERANLAIDFCAKTQATRKKLNAMPKPRADNTENKVSAAQYLRENRKNKSSAQEAESKPKTRRMK
ncbi:HipA domain-containing protein [Helicobacter sp. T3_23-1059]